MADITMCKGADEKRNLICPMRDKCYRFTARANEFRQSYFVVVPYEAPECSEFWDNTNERNYKALEVKRHFGVKQ